MIPCQNKRMLRERPSAAVVRAAASYFFARRERRRRLGDQAPRAVGVASPRAGRSRPQRSRPGRLRDRVRAVSHRLRMASRLPSLEMPNAPNAAGELPIDQEATGSSQGSPDSNNFSSQQLVKPTQWVKKKFKPLLTSERSRQQLVHHYVSIIYTHSATASRYFEFLFSARGLIWQQWYRRREWQDAKLADVFREAMRLASTLDDMLFQDQMDILRSTGAEHLIRRLYGIETVLRPLTSEAELEHANWAAADAYDLPALRETSPPAFPKARAEANKRLRIRQRLRKVLRKWPQAYGFVFELLTQNCQHPIEYNQDDLRILQRDPTLDFEMLD